MARSNSSGQHSSREAERRERRELKAMKKAARRTQREERGGEEPHAGGRLSDEETV